VDEIRVKQEAEIVVESDVAIVGGGPAGLSAAIWCAELGLKFTLIESSSAIGGQLHLIYQPIKNFPGVASVDKRKLIQGLSEQLGETTSIIYDRSVTGFAAEPLESELSDGTRLRPKVLIIATGVRRRELGIPGENKFPGTGIIISGAREPAAVSGRNVVIVGGGDAAIENALILADHARHIYIVHRRSEFTARSEFFDKLKERPNIEFLTDSIVEEFTGDDELRSVTVRNRLTGKSTELRSDNVLVRIGVVPNTERFKDNIQTDKAGYLVVNQFCETSVPGVFAIGDVANPIAPTIATAVGMGATAAKAAYNWIYREKRL
jgi:thioredoxin reductase (NADPH)